MIINSVHKTCDFIPSRPCIDTIYNPTYSRSGNTEFLYMQGGHIDFPPGQPPLGHPDRFADKCYVATRQVGEKVFSNPQQIIGAPQFPWMLAPKEVVPDTARIGCISSPHTIKLGNYWHMFFAATVGDPNCCTGEHIEGGNQYGSCLIPWGSFNMFGAWSQNGINYTLKSKNTGHKNEALANSWLYYEASDSEKAASFKGMTGLHSAIYDDGHVYVWCEFWRTTGQTQFLVRTTGLKDEIYNGASWESITKGKFPSWVNAPDDPATHWPKGNLFAHIASHVTTTGLFPGFKYILLANPNRNQIEYSLSNDLINWTQIVVIESAIKGVCDGTGDAGTVLDAHYYERDGKPFILFGSADWNLDGKPDCSQGPYYGLAIMEAELSITAADTPPPVIPPIVPPIIPPVLPPVVPPVVTLPFEYNVEQHTALDTTLLTTKKGYALGDGIYVTSSGLWCIRHEGQPPLFPASDGNQWLLHGTVVV